MAHVQSMANMGKRDRVKNDISIAFKASEIIRPFNSFYGSKTFTHFLSLDHFSNLEKSQFQCHGDIFFFGHKFAEFKYIKVLWSRVDWVSKGRYQANLMSFQNPEMFVCKQKHKIIV